MSLIDRSDYILRIKSAHRIHAVTALLGPRQCGKTTLARQYIKEQNEPVHYFDLEDPEHLNQLTEPKLALAPLKGLIVIDEIQKIPNLFPVLRVLVDEDNAERKFLILGSASRTLIKQASESLAGRIEYIELTPLDLSEVKDAEKLWLRGGFPKAYLSENNTDSMRWREAYIQTFLEQDIPNLGIQIAPSMLRRFWMMISHYHGQLCNFSELGRSLGVSHNTARHYLDILTATFMIRTLQPWYENVGKRQIKTPKIYFRDSGIYHALLKQPEKETLLMTPHVGASWEGFALEQVIRFHQARPESCFFWATQGHAEVDLLILEGSRKIAYEFKYTSTPKITKSMRIAMEDLQLDKLTIITPGEKSYPLNEHIVVSSLKNVYKDCC